MPEPECEEGLGNEILKTMRESQNLLEVGFHKAYAEGQQNPDPKQYAKREELVEELHRWDIEYRKRTGKDTLPLGEVFAVIMNHGLKEK